MNKFDVEMSLGRLAEQRVQWGRAQREFNSALTQCMHRLIHEATRNYMSINEVARAACLSPKRIRSLMREMGLNPHSSRALLAEQSAKALAENAALMGVDPSQIDLTSPLAYLPMGSKMREQMIESGVHRVVDMQMDGTEIIFERFDSGTGHLYECEWQPNIHRPDCTRDCAAMLYQLLVPVQGDDL